jgi:hypothetical protein
MSDLTQVTFDDLAKLATACEPGSKRHGELVFEIERRQLIVANRTLLAQQRAAEAETKAAEAAVVAAEAAKDNAKYMLWSVIAATISALISLVSVIYTLSHLPSS